MMHPLEEIFGELGLFQYLDVFLDQGFDSWETILDITESDLDALGVKLGHRRKLQRRIANSRGVAPEASLVSPTRPVEEARADGSRHEVAKVDTPEAAPVVVTKRKYRRHPKPDEHAPERPPSAYVLFSNKMRDDLKGRSLTFTEIAKLVGENWQSLGSSEKEPFESQAQTAKERYNQELYDYKKTPEYKKYSLYLQEFKANRASQSQDKDTSKRVKLSDGGGSSHLGVTQNSTARASRSGAGSGSESQRGSEPPPAREHRAGSAISASEPPYSAHAATHSYQSSRDESRHSSVANEIADSRSFEVSPSFSSPGVSHSIPPIRNGSWPESHRGEPANPLPQLPPLSDMFDDQGRSRALAASPEIMGFPFPNQISGSPRPSSSVLSGDSRPPSLRQGQSSAGSIASTTSYPRTPIEGSLPIQALLADSQAYDLNLPMTATDGKLSLSHPLPRRSGAEHSTASVAYDSNVINDYSPGVPAAQSATPSTAQQKEERLPQKFPSKDRSDKQASAFDGMSALLRAGEIVDRRNKRSHLPIGHAE